MTEAPRSLQMATFIPAVDEYLKSQRSNLGVREWDWHGAAIIYSELNEEFGLGQKTFRNLVTGFGVNLDSPNLPLRMFHGGKNKRGLFAVQMHEGTTGISYGDFTLSLEFGQNDQRIISIAGVSNGQILAGKYLEQDQEFILNALDLSLPSETVISTEGLLTFVNLPGYSYVSKPDQPLANAAFITVKMIKTTELQRQKPDGLIRFRNNGIELGNFAAFEPVATSTLQSELTPMVRVGENNLIEVSLNSFSASYPMFETSVPGRMRVRA